MEGKISKWSSNLPRVSLTFGKLFESSNSVTEMMKIQGGGLRWVEREIQMDRNRYRQISVEIQIFYRQWSRAVHILRTFHCIQTLTFKCNEWSPAGMCICRDHWVRHNHLLQLSNIGLEKFGWCVSQNPGHEQLLQSKDTGVNLQLCKKAVFVRPSPVQAL